MKTYSKALAALVGAIIVVVSAVADQQITAAEWTSISGALAAVVAVFQVTNKPKP